MLHVSLTEKPEPTLRLLPVYLQPASAGTGQWLDDDAQEMTEVDESVPTKAEFGVRIAGDSMEPRFVNGQTVWVKAAQYANNGDIVLCTLNDQSYCKKLRKDENGIALIFLNKKYTQKLTSNKKSGKPGFGDMAMTAMFIGLVSTYIGRYFGGFVSENGLFTFHGDYIPLVVMAVSALVMAGFVYLIEKKGKAWVDSFSIAGSMIIGMTAAVLVGLL